MRGEYDVLIAGGGMVGASFALALAPLGLRVGIIETRGGELPRTGDADARSTALAWGSRRILDSIGVFPRIADSATPIRRVHVSEHRRCGVAVLDASELDLPALGYVVENASLLRALDEALGSSGITRMQPAAIESLEMDAGCISATVAGVECRARLLVVAEGARSSTRDLLGIAVRDHDYGQSAIVANLTTDLPHRGTAWERFTPDGPLAMLPLPEARCALVWTVKSGDVDAILGLDDAAFIARVSGLFGTRLGRIHRAGRRQAWPLVRMLAASQRRGRAVLLGNAAHSLHPIAGQGFNLSLRDAAALAETVAGAMTDHGDPAHPGALDAWAEACASDQRRIGGFIDGLNSLFTLRSPGVGPLRGMGIGLLGLWPGGRRLLARHGAGVDGAQPRLARGLPLR